MTSEVAVAPNIICIQRWPTTGHNSVLLALLFGSSKQIPVVSTRSQRRQDTQSLTSLVLRASELLLLICEHALHLPAGLRTLAHMARTCMDWKEPALDVLWRDVQS